MSPKKLPTKPADLAYARGRVRVARKYLEAAELMRLDTDRSAINVSVGAAVLAGIAAGDALCVAALRCRYSGQDHSAAADLLRTIDKEAGDRLRGLVGLKAGAHYGNHLLSERNAIQATRDAAWLVDAADERLR